MIPNNGQDRPERRRIDQLGPMPTVRQQVVTLAVSAAAMIVISGTLGYFGLI
jgi:hypothetical protein